MNQQIEEVIKDAYQIFRRYGVPSDLNICTSCCVDKKTERALRTEMVHTLSREVMNGYVGSARSEPQSADEVRYFLPRMLELIAQHQELHHSTEIYLTRLEAVDLSLFTDAERTLLDRFALVFFEDFINEYPVKRGVHREGGAFDGEDAFTILLMFFKGGISIVPLLQAWLSCETDEATLHYAVQMYWDYADTCSAHGYQNAFASDTPEFRDELKVWVSSPLVKQTFAQRLLKLSDRQEWLECKAQTAYFNVPPVELIGIVYDMITS